MSDATPTLPQVPLPSPPAQGGTSPMDDLTKMDRLLAAFKMERQAYLVCNLIGVVLLVVIAGLQVTSAYKADQFAELAVVASATVGSGGLIAYATGRLLRMFDRMALVIFPQLKDLKDE